MASNFIALYGFKEFFETLPKDIRRLEFINNSGDDINLEIPDTIGNYSSLTALVLIGCVSKIPDTICKLEKLQFLSLPKNPNLQPLPDCMGGMSRLSLINLIGSNPHKTLPESVKNRLETDENFVVYPEEKYT
jgi:Leucine-rich repeat (LRR) protein